jgi:flagellar biosynthetic protein FlhB
MADNGQKTEKPTKRRLEKARREGQFPVSREMVSALQFLAFVWVLFTSGGRFVAAISAFFRELLTGSFHLELDSRAVFRLYCHGLTAVIVPILIFGAALTAILLAIQLGTTKLGISAKKLRPDFTKLNPLKRLRQVPKQNLGSFIQAVLLLPLVALAVYAIGRNSLPTLLRLPTLAIRPAAAVVANAVQDLLWRFAWVLVGLGCIDLFRQVRRHATGMRMSKQEIREEMKETDGNPQIKSRVRRIQRDLARRNMMKEIPKASAVIVNPTHYAVAIRYEMDSMAAPKVVAKGRNYLAMRIRQIALEHQVPIVENQPLAQALYKSADVGQEIPANLYRAVAEILAYIYKLMNMRRA